MKRLLTIHCEPTPQSYRHDGTRADVVRDILTDVLAIDLHARVVRRTDGLGVYVEDYKA